MIIYTAIFGPYDELKEPIHIIPGCRYICFTDQVLNSKTWELRMVKPQYDSVRQARECKILFHKYMPDFKGAAMWIDANQQIKADLMPLFDAAAPLILLKHPERNSIIEEAEECIRLKKDSEIIIKTQMMSYESVLPLIKTDLVATGLMIRKNDKQLNRFMESWFHQVVMYSRRDQLSFNATAALVGFKAFQLLPFDTLKQYFMRCNHIKK